MKYFKKLNERLVKKKGKRTCILQLIYEFNEKAEVAVASITSNRDSCSIKSFSICCRHSKKNKKRKMHMHTHGLSGVHNALNRQALRSLYLGNGPARTTAASTTTPVHQAHTEV